MIFRPLQFIPIYVTISTATVKQQLISPVISLAKLSVHFIWLCAEEETAILLCCKLITLILLLATCHKLLEEKYEFVLEECFANIISVLAITL